MSNSLFERHPEQDILADLAAEVLPEDQARSVEAHVIGCRPCAELLADAERVRRLLVTEDPGPIPLDIWRRIEGALADESALRAEQPGYAGHRRPSPQPDAVDEASTAMWRAFTEQADPPPAQEPRERPFGVVRQRQRSTRTRRDVREDSAGSHRSQYAFLAAAAAGVAVLAVGAVGVRSLSGTHQDSSASMAESLPADHSRSMVTASGTDYTATSLARQVTALMSSANHAAASTAVASGTTPKAGTVADPQRLQACLVSLGDADLHPVAVDLARWQGREAAIIVLSRVTGGYQVWAVARDCGPGKDHALAFLTVN